MVIGYKGLRSAGGSCHALRSLRKEQKNNKLCEADRGSRLNVGAKWRLDNAKSLAAMLQERSPDAACMIIPCVLGILFFRITCDVHVCLEVRDYRAFGSFSLG